MFLTKIEEAITNVEAGNVEDGIATLDALINFATDEQKYLIAEYYIKWGLLTEADTLVSELLTLYPNNGELLLLAAEIAIDLEHEDEALDYLQTIKPQDEVYIQSLILMADLYQMQGLDEVAEQKLLEAKKADPHEPYIDFGLGEFYLSKGDYRKSIPYYQTALKVNDIISGRSIYLALAEAYTLTGQFEEALTCYEKGISQKVEIHALFGYGFTAYQLERYELAIGKWEEVKELDPEYPALFLHLAKAYEQSGALTEAYETAKAGIAIDELNKELHLYCAKLALQLKQDEEAEQFLRSAISFDPGYIEAMTILTSILLASDRYEEVIDCIQYAQSYEEYDPRFDWDLATAHRQLENETDALNHYQNAYNAFKEDLDFLEEYGYFLLEAGQRHEAQQIFKQILHIDPTQAHIEEEMLRLEDW